MATIRKRGDTYQIRVSCGFEIDGKRKERSMTWKPKKGMTEKQIEKELNRQVVLFEEENQIEEPVHSITFRELADEWFEEYAKYNLRFTTYDKMELLTKRIYPAIGNIEMSELTTRTIQMFINSLAKDGANKKTGGPLSSKSIRNYLGFISDIFGYAVKMDMLPENPCQKVSVPRGEKKERQIYSLEEMNLFLSKLDNEPLRHKVFFYLLSYSGFRRSEMLGLEWRDIDFGNGIISVKRASNHTTQHGTYTDTTKTKLSRRSIIVSKIISDLLLELKHEQEQNEISFGDKWIKTERVFSGLLGREISNGTPYNWLRRFCKRNNLNCYGLHSFRHFVASSLIASGLDVTTVSRTLGHSNSTTTLNIYSHTFQTAQAKVAETMDDVLGFSNQNEKNAS